MAVLVGGLVLTGWVLDIAALKSMRPDWVSMKPNTALAFILTGFAVLGTCPVATASGRRWAFFFRASRFGAWLAGLIGLLTLAEYAFEWSPGIDLCLFLEGAGTAGTSSPGRMAPESALCFLLLAAAIEMTRGAPEAWKSPLASWIFSLAVALLALASLLTYFTPSLGPYGWWGSTIMAVPTALLFVMLGLALMLNAWRRIALAAAISNRIGATFAIGLGLLVIIGLNASRCVVQLNEANRWVTLHQQILQTFPVIEAAVLKAQASTRGFALTGEGQFRNSSLAAVAEGRVELEVLRRLMDNFSGQAARFERFAGRVEEALRWFQDGVDAGPAELTSAVGRARVLHGEELMAALRGSFRTMESEERVHLEQFSQAATNLTRFSYLTVSGGTFASFIIILGGLVELNKVTGKRRQAEAALRESEARIGRFLELIPLPVCHVTKAGVIDFRNERFLRVFGYTSGQVPTLAEWWRRAYPDPRYREWVLETWDTAVRSAVTAGQDINTVEYNVTCQNGEVRNVEITGIMLGEGILEVFIDVTEKKRALGSLRASEERFRIAAETSNDIIYEWDLKQGVRWFGKVDEMLGYAPGAFPRTLDGWVASLHPDDRRHTEAAIQAQLEGRAPYAVEYRVRHKNSDYRWWSARGAAIRDPEGRPVHWIGTITDITERKLAEAALAASERQFRAIFAQAAVGIAQVGVDGRWLQVNQRLCEIVGYTQEELLRSSYQDITHPEDLGPDAMFVRQLLTGEIATFAMEKRYIRKNRSLVWINLTVGLVRKGDGIPDYFVSVIEDITRRKQAEQQLREQNEILSNAHEGVMIVNLANEVTLWNRGAGEICGWNAAEALGRPSETMLGISDAGLVAELRTAVMRDGFWKGEVRGQARDGRKLILDCRLTLIRDETGRPRARLNYFADITEKKLLEEKFLHAQRLENVGMLAAGIAHDLNNVLAPILFAEPMLRSSLSAERDLKMLDAVAASARRGTGLVKQILGFVHSTTNEFRPTQVKHLARDVVGLIEETFPKSIRLEHDIPADIWLVQGNPTQIHQVLLNLCVNARDAMPEGGTLRFTAANRRLDATAASRIDGARPGAWLVLTVADTGAGMSVAVRERIWTPFFTTKPVGKGTGLGLTTVRSIVTGHAGFITLETAPGKGTTFTVYLPAFESAPTEKRSTTPPATYTGHGELILVADDDAAIHELIAALLENYGYRVLTCANGVEALSLFKARPNEIALVISDIDMPRLGGLALAQSLLQLRPDLPILAISGLSHQGAASLDLPTMRNLAHGFLVKPFKAEELLAAVHKLLQPAVHLTAR